MIKKVSKSLSIFNFRKYPRNAYVSNCIIAESYFISDTFSIIRVYQLLPRKLDNEIVVCVF